MGVFAYTDLAGGGYARPAVMCISALASFVLGSGVAWYRGQTKGLLEAISPARVVRLMPISGLFCMGTWCTLNAVSRLSPVFVKVLFQMKIPVTVLLSTLLLKSTYTRLQLQALLNAFLAVTTFTVIRLGDFGNPFGSGSMNSAAVGLVHAGLAVLANVLASLMAEQNLKGDRPWYITVVHVKAGEALLAFVLLCLLPGSPLAPAELLSNPLSAFAGFTTSVWGLALCLIGDTWMSSLVVKRLSSVVKALAKSLSMISLYIISLLVLKKEAFSLPLFLQACLLAHVSYQFTSATSVRRQQERAAQKLQACELRKEDTDDGGGGAPAARPPPEPRPAAEPKQGARQGGAGGGRAAGEDGMRQASPARVSEDGARQASPTRVLEALVREVPASTAIPVAVLGSIALLFYAAIQLQARQLHATS